MPHQLLVRLVQATNLRDAAHFGVQDPYVSVIFGDQLKRSKVCKGGGVCPKWEETITFDVLDHRVTSLRLSVETKKFFVVGELIGSADISLTEVYQTGTLKRKFPLITKDERQRGEIEIVVTYGDLLNGGNMASVSTNPDEDVIEGLGSSQRQPRQIQTGPMLATVSGSSWGGSAHGSRTPQGAPDNGATSPQRPNLAPIVSRPSGSSSAASPYGRRPAPDHLNAHGPSQTSTYQHPESTIFTAPPEHMLYPTVVQISPPMYPLTSSCRNNWTSQESLRSSARGTGSEDFTSLSEGMTRSISLDSTPTDAQVAAAEKQKEFRARLEALRSETSRPAVDEAQEGEEDGTDVSYEEGFYPEVKYKESPATPMYM